MNFKYLLYTSLIACGSTIQASAQANIQTLAPTPIWASEGSFLNPSYLKNTRGFQLNIAPFMGLNLRVTNNFAAAGTILDYVEQAGNDDVNFGPIHSLMDNLRNKNSVEVHSDFTLLNANFKLGKAAKAINFGFSVRQHAHMNMTVNDDFFRLMYGGNKQFAGQTVTLRPEISSIAYTDIGLAASKTISVGALKITPGVRLRYLVGNAAFQTNKTQINFFTEQNGEYIEVDGKIDANGGGMIDFDKLINDGEFETNDKIGKSMGRGFALDLGATVEYKNLSLSLASIDNGSIRFKDNAAWHISSQNTAVRWEGYDIVASQEGVEFSDNFEPLESLEVETERKAFSTSIGSKITFNGNYGLKSKVDKKKNAYYLHNVGLSYVQGFKNQYNASTSPWTAIYYQMNLKNKFTIGANFNNYRNVSDFGANVGVRFAGINLGLGTNSLFAAVNRNASKQVDFFFHLGFAF